MTHLLNIGVDGVVLGVVKKVVADVVEMDLGVVFGVVALLIVVVCGLLTLIISVVSFVLLVGDDFVKLECEKKLNQMILIEDLQNIKISVLLQSSNDIIKALSFCLCP